MSDTMVVVGMHGFFIVGDICEEDMRELQSTNKGTYVKNAWLLHTMIVPTREGLTQVVKLMPIHSNRGPVKECYVPGGVFFYEPSKESCGIFKEMIKETECALKLARAMDAGVIVLETVGHTKKIH